MMKRLNTVKWMRHTAVCLSTMIAVTSVGSLGVNAEEFYGNTDYYEDITNEVMNEFAPGETEVYQDEDTEEVITDNIQGLNEEEQMFDFYNEAEQNTSEEVQIFDVDNEEPLTDDYTIVENSQIRYKYDEATKTLYFERIPDCSDLVEIPGYSKGYQAPWFTDLINGKHCEIKKIEIGTGIVGIGNSSFRSEASAQYKYDDLEEVVLSNDVKTIGENAFADNPSLKKINLKNITEIDTQAFMNDSGLEQIEFESDSVILYMNAFRDCKNLQSVKANAIVLDKDNSKTVFSGCTKLASFSCNVPLEIIPDDTFAKTAISNIDLSKVTYIGQGAFQNTPLTQLNFGKKDITIGVMSFLFCQNITDICYPGTQEEWKAVAGNAMGINTIKAHCKADVAPVHATCETDGVKILTCKICGGEYTDGTVEPALGHDYSETYTTDTPATCTETGSESKHCTRCDAADPESVRELPALGHQWGVWKKTADATVFAAEQQERTCDTCGKKETQTVGDKLAATISVNVSSVTLKEDQNTSSVEVTGLAKGDSIASWASTDTEVFTVDGNADGTCKLTGVKKGTANLEITLASGLKKTVTVIVEAKTITTSKISGLAKKMTVKKGAKATLKPVITPANSQQKVTYSSSNKSVATVSSKGVITAKKAGTAKITVKSGSKKVTVTVTVPKIKTTAITVGKKVSVKKGKTYSLKAKVKPSNSDEKITYSTSNKKIATVSKSGKIKGVKKGTATITIKSGKITKKVKVTVK